MQEKQLFSEKKLSSLEEKDQELWNMTSPFLGIKLSKSIMFQS